MSNDFQEGYPEENLAILILSGGMDSTTLLYKIIDEGKKVRAISIDYGQKHSKELKMAAKTCEMLRVPHKVVDLSVLKDAGFFAKSSLTSEIEVPEGHYEEESMKSTVVPNRNMIMLSLAIGYAITHNAKSVYYGAHSGDHAIYPDCRPEFVQKMRDAAAVCHYYPVDIRAPFENYTKGDIVKEGIELGVNYSLTWTCYKGQDKACGKCGSCSERIEAFTENGVNDPIDYASNE